MAGALVVAVAALACGSANVRPGGIPLHERPSGQVASAAPNINVETFHHGTYNLEENVGRPVLINFWFPSCPPCRAELPDLQAAYEKYGDEVDFLGVQQVSVDTEQEGIEFLDGLGITYPNFADVPAAGSTLVQFQYEVLSYPTTIFLNRDHSINREWVGLINESNLEEQIEAVIGS